MEQKVTCGCAQIIQKVSLVGLCPEIMWMCPQPGRCGYSNVVAPVMPDRIGRCWHALEKFPVGLQGTMSSWQLG